MKEIGQQIKLARRAMGLTQGELAHAVGCKQSAISMMEAGKADAVNGDTLAKIATHLAIDLATPSTAEGVREPRRAYCPNAECPSNVPIVLGDDLLFVPMVQRAEAKHCCYCGEFLEKVCPECGAAVHAGACCCQCGTSYVTNTLTGDVALADGVAVYASARRDAIEQMMQLTR